MDDNNRMMTGEEIATLLLEHPFTITLTAAQLSKLENQVVKHRALPGLWLPDDPFLLVAGQIFDQCQERAQVLLAAAKFLEQATRPDDPPAG